MSGAPVAGPGGPGHDTPFGRDLILVVALVGVLVVTAVVALIADGPEWLAVPGVAASLLGAIALMRAIGWLIGPSEYDE